MKYNEEDIEFASQILTRRENLSDEAVKMWMSDPEHVELLKEFGAIRGEYSDLNFEAVKAAEYARLRKAVAVRTRRQLVLRWSVAASIALWCLACGIYWMTLIWQLKESCRNRQKS